MLFALLLACTSVVTKETGDSACVADEYADEDHDGYGDATRLVCDGVPNPDDCNDADGGIHPNVIDDCNGYDDNCDGVMDDHGNGVEAFPDEDGDGWGDETRGYFTCDGTGVTTPGDCDDTNAATNPDATELPDNGIDDDCDGYTDETS